MSQNNKLSSFKLDTSKYASKLIENLVEKGILTKSDKPNSDILNSQLESYLIEQLREGKTESYFQLGQVYFEKEDYSDSFFYFKEGAEKIMDFQCMFQLAIIYYDGLGIDPDPELGCAYMKKILEYKNNPLISHLKFGAAYNLGRAAYQGFGMCQSDQNAEMYWLMAADDGNPQACIMAQTALGFFYSSKEHLDLKKAFFWHSEACGNGSIESQACIGVFYLYGIGVNVDWAASLVCLENAAQRGSIYAKGHLCYYYYKRKLFTKTADLSSQVSGLNEDDISELSKNSSIIIIDYLRKAISIACFIFARCLNLGLGVQKNPEEALKYFSKSFQWDPELCADFQKLSHENKL